MSSSPSKRWSLVLVAVIAATLCTIAALVRPPEASALVGPNPATTAPWVDEVISLILSPPAIEGEGAAVAVGRAQVAVLELSVGSTVAASIGALGVGILIGGTINHYFHVSCRIAHYCDPDLTIGAHGMDFVRWEKEPCLSGGTYCPPVADRAGYYYAKFHGNVISWTDPVCCNADFYTYTDPGPVSYSNGKYWFQDAQATFTQFETPEALSNGWYGIRRTEDAFRAMLEVDASEPYTNQPHSTTINLDTFPWGYGDPEWDEIIDALLSGNTASDFEIGQLLNPAWEGEELEWAAPEAGESYAAYLNRLRESGWAGQVTTVQLDGTQGDVEKGLGAVACTSAVSGSTLPSGAPVTLYLNITSGPFGNDEQPTNGQSCGGGWWDQTLDDPPCSFRGESWASVTAGNESWYQALCEQARSDFASRNLISSDGSYDSALDIDDFLGGQGLLDEDAQEGLAPAGSGRSLSEFWKAKSQVFTTPLGYDYSVHYYYDVTNDKIITHGGFKIRFEDVYRP